MTTYQRTDNQNTNTVRRRATSSGLSLGPLATTLTIGVVMVLLGVTFVGDWLRTPTITGGEASPSIISPNSDGVQDVTNLSYTLGEDADVVVQVLNESGAVVRTLRSEEFQTMGQHVVMWDGRNDLGQAVSDGAYQLQVVGMGTVRAAQQSAAVTVDTIPPRLQLANLDNARRVREATLDIEGVTEPDAVVRLADDARIVPVETNGQFSFKRQLIEGVNDIELVATDPAGNITRVSREVNLVTRAPEINVAGAYNDMWTNDGVLEITGPVPAGITIKVNGQTAATTLEGMFQHEVVLDEGDNTILIEAIDDVGNTTSQEMIVHRKTIPPILSLNIDDNVTFQQDEVQVMGQTEAGATVAIGGQAVNVSPIGEFQTTVKLQAGQNLLEVVATDQAGNVTTQQKRINYELSPPQSAWTRVASNVGVMSDYVLPVAVSLPVLFMLAYFFTRPVSLSLSSESQTFQPGLPAEGRYLRMYLDLSKAARTTVEVRDRLGRTVSTLQYRRQRRGGQQTLYWNGYDDFGKVVPPGEYTVQATATTTGGTVSSVLNIAVVGDKAAHRYQSIRQTTRQDDDTLEVNRDYLRPTTQQRVQRTRRS